MAITPITQFPCDEAACVFDTLSGTCKDDAICKLHCAAIFFSYAQRQAQTVAQPAGLKAVSRADVTAQIGAMAQAHRAGKATGINVNWLQIAQVVLNLLLQIFAGLTPAPAPVKGGAKTLACCGWSFVQSYLDDVLEFAGATAAENLEHAALDALNRGVCVSAIAEQLFKFGLPFFKSGSIDVDGLTAAINGL